MNATHSRRDFFRLVGGAAAGAMLPGSFSVEPAITLLKYAAVYSTEINIWGRVTHNYTAEFLFKHGSRSDMDAVKRFVHAKQPALFDGFAREMWRGHAFCCEEGIKVNVSLQDVSLVIWESVAK